MKYTFILYGRFLFIREIVYTCRFKWLFIFDNIEDPCILPAYLPHGMGVEGCGHVIVTSRIQHFDWVLRGSVLTLDCFDTQDSVKYLQRTLGILSMKRSEIEGGVINDEAVLKQICLRMGNLPLALSIAVAYMVRCDVSPVDYLNHVNSTAGGNMDAISTSLNVTLKQIRAECESSVAVLPCLGYFAPDNISKDLVKLFLFAVHRSGGGRLKFNPFVEDNASDTSICKMSSGGSHGEYFRVDLKFDNVPLLSMAVLTLLWSFIVWTLRQTALNVRDDCSNVVIEYFRKNDSNINFVFGMVSGCLLLIDLVIIVLWSLPRHCLCWQVTDINDGALENCTVSIVEGRDSIEKPSLDIIDFRREGVTIDPQISIEADKIWEIIKQFSLLSIRGSKGSGSVHRLQQAVLRDTHDDSKYSTVQAGIVQKVLCLERCIWVLSKLWKFSKADAASWQKAGDTIEHLHVIAQYAIDLLPDKYSEPASVRDSLETFSNEISSPRICVEYYLLLSVLLKEGGEYISVVLSRFDSAQQLLEWSHQIQSYLLELLSLSSSTSATSLPLNFKIHFYEKLSECRASTLYVLGKILRYNDKLDESEVILKESLELRKRNHGAALDPTALNNNGAIADILHELGVLHLRKHDLYTAKSFLTRSLNMKYEYEGEIQETDESSTLHQLGVVATLERRYDDAESLLLQALKFQDHRRDETVRASSHAKNVSGVLTSKAATLQQLGRVELRRGRLAQAEGFLSESLEIYRLAYGEARSSSHVNVAGVRHQLGAAAMAAKDYKKACEHFSIALAAREIICSQSSGGKDQLIVELLALGQAEVERHRYNIAETLFLRAKSSIEIDLNCIEPPVKTVVEQNDSGDCDSDQNTADGNVVPNYSRLMLSKCGYSSNNRNKNEDNLEDNNANERKTDFLIKQLFFCVHLLRGVARQCGDGDAAVLYSSELKNISKKYPSHRSSSKKNCADSLNEKRKITNSEIIANLTVLESVDYDTTIDIFEHIFRDNGFADKFQCRSEVFIVRDVMLLSSKSSEFKELIWLVAARCNIRACCKVVQKISKENKSDDVLQELMTVVCHTLPEGTTSLGTLDNDRVSMTLQLFIEDSSTTPRPWVRKVFLNMLFKLCDDLRTDMKSYGLHVNDL